MLRRVRFIGVSADGSRLEGYNYGPYPIHHFYGVNRPEAIYPLWLSVCGLDEWRRECYRERKCSDIFSVEYVQEGVFVFQQNNVTMRVHPGNLFLVHQGMDNSMRCETEFAMKRVVIMKGEMLQPMLETLGLAQIHQICPVETQRIDDCFDRLDRLVKDGGQVSSQEVSIACYALLVELAEQATIRRRPAELRKALECINGHLDVPLSLAELARKSGTSQATLHRQFRTFMNASPIEYYLAQRLERAKLLLENYTYSVKEVAERLSFASAKHLSTAFRKKYGIPPKSCKRRLYG
ncbi:MAG: helix-turn-helix transcriptional regulator [Victivallales bacterium]|nr:helix-turn-helix transcriptional regulator [Victivallales bacterium]